MNNLALVTFLFFAFFFAFLKQKHYFCVYFQLSLSTTFKKPFDNYEKVLLFLHTTIIANYRHCTNIQIHRCGRRFEQQTGICNSKGT